MKGTNFMAQHRRRRDRTGSAPVGLRVQDAVHDAVPCLEEVLVVGLVDRHLRVDVKVIQTALSIFYMGNH